MLFLRQLFITRLIARLSRNKVIKRRLPKRAGGGKIFVTPGSALSYWRTNLDNSEFGCLFDWVEEFVKPGNIVWDIGANVGLFTFAAANRIGTRGQVVAFEPDTVLFDLLQKSLRLKNFPPHISIIPVAVSDTVDLIRFNISAKGRSSNYIDAVHNLNLV